MNSTIHRTLLMITSLANTEPISYEKKGMSAQQSRSIPFFHIKTRKVNFGSNMKALRQTLFRLITRHIQYKSPHIDINPNKPVVAVKAIFVEKYSRLQQSVQNKQVSTSTSLRNFTPPDDYVFCKEESRTLGCHTQSFHCYISTYAISASLILSTTLDYV